MARPGSDTDFAGSISELYDSHLTDLRTYAAELASRVAARDPSRVLDTAAGTGLVTRAMERTLPALVDLVATDLNQPMLDRAAASSTQPTEGRSGAQVLRTPWARMRHSRKASNSTFTN